MIIIMSGCFLFLSLFLCVVCVCVIFFPFSIFFICQGNLLLLLSRVSFSMPPGTMRPLQTWGLLMRSQHGKKKSLDEFKHFLCWCGLTADEALFFFFVCVWLNNSWSSPLFNTEYCCEIGPECQTPKVPRRSPRVQQGLVIWLWWGIA